MCHAIFSHRIFQQSDPYCPYKNCDYEDSSRFIDKLVLTEVKPGQKIEFVYFDKRNSSELNLLKLKQFAVIVNKIEVFVNNHGKYI